MPINANDLKTINSKPTDFAEWAGRVKQAGQNNGLVNLSVVTDHHICPQNVISGLRNEAISRTKEACLIEAAAYAVSRGVVSNQGSDQDKLSRLMERIVWAFGNVFPGPENVTRIDDPMNTGGWEQKKAFLNAHAYAKKLETILRAIQNAPILKSWKALVDHINPLAKLAKWEQTANNSQGQDRDIALKHMCEDINQLCASRRLAQNCSKRWLDHHPTV